MPNLDALLQARSVAVIGASSRADSFGRYVVRQLLDFGYAGQIFPINPGYTEIEGLRCYVSLAAVPAPVDCAAICVADERILVALESLISRGIPAAVIYGTAAGETGDGTRLTDAIRRRAIDADLALMGAGCMGFLNFPERLFLTGYPYHREPGPGTVSFITHSGSTLSAVAKNTRGLDFNYVISPGQELVLSAADYLNFVINQPETRVVGLFIETIRDSAGFQKALEAATSRGIPVVMLKVGRTLPGAAMALAHTGALAGAHAAIEALADRHNVVLVRTIEELLDTLELFSSGRVPTTRALAAITDSGGERGMMVDLASDIGVDFARLSAATTATLATTLDPGLEPGNPADLWGSGHDWQRVFRTCIQAMLADDAVGAFNFGIDFNIGSRLGPDYRAIAVEAFQSTIKPFAVITNVAAGMNPDEALALRSHGIPVLMGTETGLLAFNHLFRYHQRRSRGFDENQDAEDVALLTTKSRALLKLGRPLTEPESMHVLESLGFPCLPHWPVDRADDLHSIALATGFPLVIKTAEPGVLHKSDRGGVHTGISSAEQLTQAYDHLARTFGPLTVVQRQVDIRHGVELFLGMSLDPQFGPLVTVGLGGIWIETLDDSVTFLAPCSQNEVRQRIPALKGIALLTGARGRRAVDLDALARLVAQFSQVAVVLAGYAQEIDINPMVATGDEFTVLDALIVPINLSGGADGTS